MRKLSHVTAQPTEDPADPLVILRDLPEQEREEFLRQYHQAVEAPDDPLRTFPTNDPYVRRIEFGDAA